MINLLPPQHKKELRGEEQFRLVLILGMLLMVFFVCLSLSLLAIRIYVSGEIQTRQILAEAQRVEENGSRLEQIRQRNADIGGIASFYAGRIVLSDIVDRIASALPESMHVTSLIYTKGKIALAGFAPSTEDLLSFRTRLEAEPLFKNFRFPSSNWVEATDIDFSFDFEL